MGPTNYAKPFRLSSYELDTLVTLQALYSVAGGSVHCVKRLIKCGASLSRRNRVGWHALHYATAAGHLYVAQLLLKAGQGMASCHLYVTHEAECICSYK